MCAQCRGVVSDSQNTPPFTNTMWSTLTPSPTTVTTVERRTDRRPRWPCTNERRMEKIQQQNMRLRCTTTKSLVSTVHQLIRALISTGHLLDRAHVSTGHWLVRLLVRTGHLLVRYAYALLHQTNSTYMY